MRQPKGWHKKCFLQQLFIFSVNLKVIFLVVGGGWWWWWWYVRERMWGSENEKEFESESEKEYVSVGVKILVVKMEGDEILGENRKGRWNVYTLSSSCIFLLFFFLYIYIFSSCTRMLGPGVSPTSPRARATPHGGNKWRKKTISRH